MFTVYRIFDRRGRALYVGCSANPTRRLAQHRRKSWGHRIGSIECTNHRSQRRALDIERAEIIRLKPAENWRHHPDRRGPRKLAVGTLRDRIVVALSRHPLVMIGVERALGVDSGTPAQRGRLRRTVRELVAEGVVVSLPDEYRSSLGPVFELARPVEAP